MNQSKPNRSIFYEFDSFQESVPCSFEEITFAIGSYWKYFDVVFPLKTIKKILRKKVQHIPKERYTDVCRRTN